MNRLFIAALLASVAFAPAYAGKGDGKGRALERAENKVESLQEELQQPDLSEREAARIEDAIDRIVDKFDIELPPPPPEDPPTNPDEPIQLFKDDFNRDQTEPGNGWTGDNASVSDQQLLLGTVYQTVDLGGLKYKSITVSWDMIVEVNSAGDVVGQDAKMYWSEGDILADKTLGVTTVMNEFPDQRHYSFTTQEKDPLLYLEPYYDSFSFGFDAGRTRIDNVVVTGVLWEEPTGDFVGF
jgi:hypothetical protein